MRTIAVIGIITSLLYGCALNPLGSDSTINVYAWDDRDTPFDSRDATVNDTFQGFFDGDTSLADLLDLHPNLDQSAATPYLVEACDINTCYQAVAFPADLSQKDGKLRGFVVLSGISTALYNEVKNSTESAVRGELDALSARLINTDLNGDDVIDYSDVVAADFRYPTRKAALNDDSLPATLNQQVESGNQPTLSDFLDAAVLTAWIENSDERRSQVIMESSSNLGVLVNVQSVSQVSSGGADFALVEASGIPDYSVEISQQIHDWLNSRPQAASDFGSGATTASVGQVVAFGEDIGYSSNSNSCNSGEGYGYWPPGPECPEDVAHSIYLPLEPAANSSDCDTGAGSVGYYVNGTSVFNWTDAQSYNSEGVWQTLAPEAELYDVDICGGHAANGEYHHHFYSQCLADLVGDEGDAHSPLYGFAADGYPIYGPWQADGQLALSAWRSRDYDNQSSATGCGDSRARSCLLVDQYDVGQGTVAAGSDGPDTDGSYTSMSQNVFDTPSGFFFEDWYWDENLTAQGGVYLDQYNGHSDEQRGYHYHVTIEVNGDSATPAFPYSVGPRYAGELQNNASASCSTGTIGTGGGGDAGDGGNMPPPGGGMPPPPMGA